MCAPAPRPSYFSLPPFGVLANFILFPSLVCQVLMGTVGASSWCLQGFVAKPDTLPDGSVNLMVWRCVIPGKQGTDWEGGYFPLTLEFNDDYPTVPPVCKFPSGFFHVNVYDSGLVCLSILSSGWKPSITVKQVLVGIQELLDDANPNSAAQQRCYELYKKNMPEYKNRVREQAKRYPSRV
ncbi:SUMO-conjugating enzyme SCE1 isoform X1 [Brachypodium distachyon]|uniref:SUMO-conjugating enzyme SCE1 isoform X1 n=1 Tax=Brachypodium distachyon TaxID=15368 RepID=UPI00052FEB4E|nr:SUMO-conjugating enzyme SCE1 isoform X1 [Brachypodium distachyon]|eukprot:XP_010240304.1 SUMO-conjugating enzyme SCE1 isoform X1 [Brachypodium distachyon]